MSPILKQFFKELQQWVQDGTPEDGRPFRECEGVCGNLDNWLYSNRENTRHIRDVANEHSDLLFELCGTCAYPFNYGDRVSFISEAMEGAHWRNKARLHYVKQQAEDVCH